MIRFLTYLIAYSTVLVISIAVGLGTQPMSSQISGPVADKFAREHTLRLVSTTDATTPRIEPVEIDCGTIRSDEKRAITLWIRNDTGAHARFSRVVSSCGCTAISLGKQAAQPGEFIPVTLVLSIPARSGPEYARSIGLVTESGTRIPFRVRVRREEPAGTSHEFSHVKPQSPQRSERLATDVSLRRALIPSPRRVELGSLSPGESTALSVRVTMDHDSSEWLAPAVRASLRAAPGTVSIENATYINGGAIIEIAYTAPPDAIGVIRGQVRVDLGERYATIELSADIRPDSHQGDGDG